MGWFDFRPPSEFAFGDFSWARVEQGEIHAFFQVIFRGVAMSALPSLVLSLVWCGIDLWTKSSVVKSVLAADASSESVEKQPTLIIRKRYAKAN